ncbi:MAG: ABC transporter ATP-binding protein [Muribaculaceae bacterium]|nr:ABC transporter ATP-binding protein [Muribaculaceae bacterium]
MEPLTLHELQCGYPGAVILDGISGTLHGGVLTALLGANGIGKSTLLRTICGVQPSLGGEVIVEGKPLKDMSRKELAQTISIVNTDQTGAGGLTVEELVALGRHPFTGFFGRLSGEDHKIVRNALEAVGMAHRSKDYVATLSDGMRQKVMIARALAQTTPIIVLDEPTAFLDAASRIETIRLLQKLATEQGKAVLISTHDIGQVLPLASHLWLLTHDRHFITGETGSLTSDSCVMDSLFSNRNVRFDPLRQEFF